ncbi:MAG: hypothetical protein JW904_10635 [Spirochaetales bacterium]|nr:hypothetical protein [Spirochaetales bacterium]
MDDFLSCRFTNHTVHIAGDAEINPDFSAFNTACEYTREDLRLTFQALEQAHHYIGVKTGFHQKLFIWKLVSDYTDGR